MQVKLRETCNINPNYLWSRVTHLCLFKCVPYNLNMSPLSINSFIYLLHIYLFIYSPSVKLPLCSCGDPVRLIWVQAVKSSFFLMGSLDILLNHRCIRYDSVISEEMGGSLDVRLLNPRIRDNCVHSRFCLIVTSFFPDTRLIEQ